MLKIGIITPFSNQFPFMARDFVRGIQLAFVENEDVQFVHVETERGIPNEVSPLLRQLIIKEEVHMVIGFLESTIISHIKEMLKQTGVPFILSGMGARLPLSTDENLPEIFYNSFRLWESCWLSGSYAASVYGQKAGVFCSFFDGGYPLSYAHMKGAEAGGGVPAFFAITHKEKTEEELLKARQSIGQFPADYYFLAYYGKERASILDWFSQIGVSSEKLVASPGIHPNGETPTAVTSWHHDWDTTENREFCEMYRNRHSSEPDEFAMLGYENGLWVKQALQNNGETFNRDSFINGLKEARFIGPRGEVTVNAKLKMASSDHLLVQVDAGTQQKQFKILAYPKQEIEQEIEANQPANLMGWQNTYLCK